MAYFSHDFSGLKGVDVSQWQGMDMNWATAKAQGIDFAIVQVLNHNGTSDLDADTLYATSLQNNAYRNCQQAFANGLAVIGYHFITPNLFPGIPNAKKEAERFARSLQYCLGNLYPGYPYGKYLPVLDVEYPNPNSLYLGGVDEYLTWIDTCAQELMRICGFNTVIMYSSKWYADITNDFVHSTRGQILAKYPLWNSLKEPSLYTGVNSAVVSAYPNSNWNLMGGWTDWLLWQYSLDAPDTRYGATYGVNPVSNADIDLDCLKPGLTLSALENDSWKPRKQDIGGRTMPAGGTNLQHLSISGDEYMISPKTGKEVLVKQLLMTYKNFTYSDIINTAKNVNGVANTLRLIEGIPGKQIYITKVQAYCPSTSWAGGTQGMSIESDEVTPKVWVQITGTNMTSGNKTNTDGFTGFTAGGNFMQPFPDGVGIQARDIATPTAGVMYLNIYYYYI